MSSDQSALTSRRGHPWARARDSYRSDTKSRICGLARYGCDVKYASHALRLAHQGLEIVRDGRLTLPMPEHLRPRVVAIKRGVVTDLADVLREIDVVRAEVQQCLDDGTPLPAEPDWAAVSAWSVDAHRRHWGWALTSTL